MIKIYIYTCLLSALTIVEVKTLHRNGHVGKSVTFICSDWNVWTNTENNVKYLCQSPCSKDKDIIIKAAFGKTERKDRIYLTNTRQGLNVTFTNLQKSDSKKYICGLERFGPDSYIEMHLQVTDDPTTTAKSTTVGSTVPLSVLNSFIMSSSTSDIITDMFTSYTTLHTTTATGSTTAGAGVPYLIIGSIVIITILMVVLKLTRKMMKKQQTSNSDGQQEDTQGSAGPDEVYQSLHFSKEDKDQVYSTLTPSKRSAGPDEVYQSPHLSMENKDQFYSTLTLSKRSAGPDEVYQLLHLSMENKDQVDSNLTLSNREWHTS